MTPKPLRRLTASIAALAAIVSLAACGAGSGGDATTLSLVGFAVPKAGNNAVQAAWAKTDAGKGVTWSESYGASGDQSRAVEKGLKADVVHFSVTPDVTRLVDAGLVADTWDDGANKGILTDSVVVLVVREGNPKGITGWDDLAKDGVQIVTPNPGSSGAARWNILGAWQHIIAAGGSEDDAKTFLGKVLANVAAFPGSGRDATQAFESGTGDVLISYENEAVLARQEGQKFDYIVPDDTLLIENPAAVTKDANPKAQQYLDFALSAEGQKIYASKGFRPLPSAGTVDVGTVEGANDPSNPFPEVKTLFTIDGDFGGWSEVKTKFFDENTGIITKLQQEAGLS
ncbi:sulfate ABC transporter substrate-binding protein [Rarobacter incanus]|uniref:Sulfate transport system substrate-binding protein n=1 Tax=Rarobacter incanus TaxID=153494 RepID=A0A542SPX0_9MICO|nr:sulfate ABC transporter substrate-binding protein [Rarobacter incanus]TQK76615.1 sulfate transport system substrate-binding protein [Rarobacter incanus]